MCIIISNEIISTYQKAQMWASCAEEARQIGTSCLRQEGNQVYQPKLQCQVLQEVPKLIVQR